MAITNKPNATHRQPPVPVTTLTPITGQVEGKQKLLLPLLLPSCPFFIRLFNFAQQQQQQQQQRAAIRDVVANTQATHLRLLTDALVLRDRLRRELNLDPGSRPPQSAGRCSSVQEKKKKKEKNNTDKREEEGQHDESEETYIAILAAGGYEYAVAMLAVLALGAVAVPLSPAIPPDETVYYIRKSRAAAVLASSAAVRAGVEVEMLVKNSNPKSTFICMPIDNTANSLKTRAWSATYNIQISSEDSFDEDASAVVFWTSGTTGPPKGAVMRRSYIFDYALSVCEHYKITASDVLLHILPAHHVTGIGIMFFPFLMAGACIEFRSGPFDPGWTWERWRRGGLTFFSGTPAIYARMMHLYQQYFEHKIEADEYANGARNLRICICGTSALPSTTADFWAKMLNREVLQRYGGSEFGAVIKVRMNDENVPDGSVGEVFPGVDLKLSRGEEGEVLVKSPYMFSKYLFDDKATLECRDQQGYYKTGDIARREGKYYWILGREATDLITSGGYKISALDVERELMTLDYVSDCTVVGVADDDFGQRVAVALALKMMGEAGPSLLTLRRLRRDLSQRLARYKLPTILRVVEGEVPKTSTGKVSKKELGPRLFPPYYRTLREVQFWEGGLVYNSPRALL